MPEFRMECGQSDHSIRCTHQNLFKANLQISQDYYAVKYQYIMSHQNTQQKQYEVCEQNQSQRNHVDQNSVPADFNNSNIEVWLRTGTFKSNTNNHLKSNMQPAFAGNQQITLATIQQHSKNEYQQQPAQINETQLTPLINNEKQLTKPLSNNECEQKQSQINKTPLTPLIPQLNQKMEPVDNLIQDAFESKNEFTTIQQQQKSQDQRRIQSHQQTKNMVVEFNLNSFQVATNINESRSGPQVSKHKRNSRRKSNRLDSAVKRSVKQMEEDHSPNKQTNQAKGSCYIFSVVKEEQRIIRIQGRRRSARLSKKREMAISAKMAVSAKMAISAKKSASKQKRAAKNSTKKKSKRASTNKEISSQNQISVQYIKQHCNEIKYIQKFQYQLFEPLTDKDKQIQKLIKGTKSARKQMIKQGQQATVANLNTAVDEIPQPPLIQHESNVNLETNVIEPQTRLQPDKTIKSVSNQRLVNKSQPSTQNISIQVEEVINSNINNHNKYALVRINKKSARHMGTEFCVVPLLNDGKASLDIIKKDFITAKKLIGGVQLGYIDNTIIIEQMINAHDKSKNINPQQDPIEIERIITSNINGDNIFAFLKLSKAEQALRGYQYCLVALKNLELQNANMINDNVKRAKAYAHSKMIGQIYLTQEINWILAKHYKIFDERLEESYPREEQQKVFFEIL